MDVVWRDYCLQHLPGAFRLTPSADERARITEALWDAARQEGSTFAGTALISLHRIAQEWPDAVKTPDLADAARMASMADETPEGRSIVVLAKDRFGIREREREGEARVLYHAWVHQHLGGNGSQDSPTKVDSPRKRAATEAWGAEVVVVGPDSSERAERCARCRRAEHDPQRRGKCCARRDADNAGVGERVAKQPVARPPAPGRPAGQIPGASNPAAAPRATRSVR